MKIEGKIEESNSYKKKRLRKAIMFIYININVDIWMKMRPR